MLVDRNWHLHLAWEKYWPQLVYGTFLWEGKPLNPRWCKQCSRWLDQLEDGELVNAHTVYSCSNYMVAPFLKRYDDDYVEIRTKGHITLGEAVREYAEFQKKHNL